MRFLLFSLLVAATAVSAQKVIPQQQQTIAQQQQTSVPAKQQQQLTPQQQQIPQQKQSQQSYVCADTDTKLSLFKDATENTYKIIFTNLNPAAFDPDWVDLHIRSPTVGEANIRIISDGLANHDNVATQPGLVIHVGESLVHYATYGKYDSGLACNTKTLMYTRAPEGIATTTVPGGFSYSGGKTAAVISQQQQQLPLQQSLPLQHQQQNVAAATAATHGMGGMSGGNFMAGMTGMRYSSGTSASTDFTTQAIERAYDGHVAAATAAAETSSSHNTDGVDSSFTESTDSAAAAEGSPCPAVQLTRRLMVNSALANTYKLMFEVPAGSKKLDFLELHYKLNEEPYTNLRLGNEIMSGSSVHQDGIVVRPKDTLTYFATYSVNDIQCDTNTYVDKLQE